MENLDTEKMGVLLGAIVMFNMILSGLSLILDAIKNKTATKLDNKLAMLVNKVSKAFQKAVDFIGMNRPH